MIHTGDFFGVLRLDGIFTVTMYGTGAHVGHCVVAMWENGELYIVESNDGAGPGFWPVDRIQKTRFKQWLKWAEYGGYSVVHMPLSPENRAKFNEKAAQDWFKSVQGLPYGYHNFLYGWVDTPDDNWPVFLGKNFVPVAFALYERFNSNFTDTFYSAAINKHLGTEGLRIGALAHEAGKRGLTLSEAMAIAEQDGWKYKGEYHDGLSMVCSSFVVNFWKAGGLFGDLNIVGQEWTPKDVYQVDVFDKNFQRPAACQEADPDQPYCQILGKYRVTFPGYSSIPMYDHMNEKCPSVAPDYVRPDGC